MFEGYLILPERKNKPINVMERNEETRRRLTEEIAVERASALRVEAPDPVSTEQKILEAVCLEYGVKPHSLIGRSQYPLDVVARNDLFYRLRKRSWTLVMIGNFCGGKHHSTIKHGLRQHKRRLAEAPGCSD
jgi:chromosomal replication initiation ATPase DnaA